MTDHEFAQKYQLARVYEETRDLTSAIRLYGELHKARPDYPEVSEALFRDLYSLKRYGECDTLLVDRLTHEQEKAEIYLDLGRVRSKLNKKSEALDAFDHALHQANDPMFFSSTLMVAQTMMEVGYQEEALALLIRERKKSIAGEQFTDQIGGLYFKLGKYEEGTKEYLAFLGTNEMNLSLVEQRIAYFTADTTIRRQIIRIVTSHVDADQASPTELRLLGWCYGELKNYKGALAIFIKLDNLGSKSASQTYGGYELLQFAERIRNEGALDVAVMAYNEAIKRFRQSSGNDLQKKNFISMAELGSLKAREVLLKTTHDEPNDSLERLVADYQNFAKLQTENNIAFDALLRAGELSFKALRNYPEAKLIYENILTRSQSYSERTRDTYFALEEIALAQGDIPTANLQLDVIDGIISQRRRAEDADTRKHILFERARIEYYKGNFDSSLVILDSVIKDPNSDYANDAIGLHSLISENTANDPALKLFAKAELTALGKDLNAALSAYRSIPETYPTATIADESILRAAEIMVQLKKPNDAVTILETMMEKMLTSPLLDKASFRQAEITETLLKEKPKAQRMYEDFLERFPKSPLGSEARKRARALRGDSF